MAIIKGFVLGYLILVVLAWLFQRQLLYMPTPGGAIVHSLDVIPIEIPSGELKLSGWVLQPGQEQALLYYGGNAESIEANLDWFRRWLPGISIYLIPYRGYSGNPGRPAESALLQDALTVYDQITPQHQTIHLLGRSLGSGIASYVAAHRPIDKLVLVSPYDSIENIARQFYWYLPVGWLLWDKYRAVEQVPGLLNDTLVVIASHDEVINPRHSQRLVSAFKQQTPVVTVIPGASHNTLDHFSAYGRAIQQFLTPETTITN